MNAIDELFLIFRKDQNYYEGHFQLKTKIGKFTVVC